ncbi:RNA polymerase sigma-70 factor [Butyricimonas paravirosa]|uniref:RNA polymerase sigma-70 factor n=5 Tax=Odoribacteraceae TaxID=1853231 RepID=A0A7X6BLJ7_9BACT|nr:RNA polymerase sigma-70 factor (ECF subfamily) [Butyricimonas paravirosa]WOF12117.1 RNA polymerase sigma-70 factor [Butyricimonas paravirosa]
MLNLEERASSSDSPFFIFFHFQFSIVLFYICQMTDALCEIEIDKKLFAAIIQGDRNAFGNLFQKYYQVLCNYALTYLDSTSEAEDAVQDVFVYVWNNREVIVVGVSVKSYLYTSVKHRALNVLKHQAMERNHSRLLVEFLEDLAREEYSEEETMQLEKIRQALQVLPSQCRTVFMMSSLEGKKYKEIAEELNISVNTVKSHILKAYRTIREYVGVSISSSFLFFVTHKICSLRVKTNGDEK